MMHCPIELPLSALDFSRRLRTSMQQLQRNASCARDSSAGADVVFDVVVSMTTASLAAPLGG